MRSMLLSNFRVRCHSLHPVCRRRKRAAIFSCVVEPVELIYYLRTRKNWTRIGALIGPAFLPADGDSIDLLHALRSNFDNRS